MMFVSLPVTDLDRAKAYYEALGYQNNPVFTDQNAAGFVVEADHSFFMLTTREFFATFTKKRIGDPAHEVTAGVTLSLESREAVDAMAERAIAAGGTEAQDPQDLGFMYSRDLDDPDGNTLGFFWMDPQAAEQGPGTADHGQA